MLSRRYLGNIGRVLTIFPLLHNMCVQYTGSSTAVVQYKNNKNEVHVAQVRVDDAWDSCTWFLNGATFCTETSPSSSSGGTIPCVGVGEGVSGGTMEDDRTCNLVFGQFLEEHSGEWYE